MNRAGFSFSALLFACCAAASTLDARTKTWTVQERNAFGQALKIRTPEGRFTSSTYTATGLTASSTDIMNYVTQFAYDARHRLSKTNLPGGAYTQTEYDALGRVRSSRKIIELQQY